MSPSAMMGVDGSIGMNQPQDIMSIDHTRLDNPYYTTIPNFDHGQQQPMELDG